MSSIVEKTLKYFDDDKGIRLGTFIGKMIESGEFDNCSISEVENVIKITMENTNRKNMAWIRESNILNKYMDLFVKYFSRIKFNNDNRFLYYVLEDMEKNKISIDSFNVLVNQVLKCDVILSYREISSLNHYAWKNKISIDDSFYEMLLKGANTCDGMIAYIDYCSSEHKRLIYKNIDSILNIENIDLYRLKNISLNNSEVCNKINDKINCNVKKYVTSLVCDYYCNHTENRDVKKDTNFNNILEVVYLILEDIARNEKVPLSSISIISSGAYSFVLRLGDKIIKIGEDRGTMSFNNNPYVNAMLLRKSFPINSKHSLFIEVNERVDDKSYVSDEELYQLYKKIRDIGLIWLDVGERNVGRLLKDNVIHWNGNLKPTDKVLGLDEYRGNEILKKGEIVVLDNDYIFDEDNIPEEMEIMDRNISSYEKRYQMEKNKGNKIREI